jgi:hypothetical protein
VAAEVFVVEVAAGVEERTVVGKIRSCGGFDTVVFTEERIIGVEVKPEFSLTEFERALGEVIKHLISEYWSIRIEEGIIVMPYNNLGTSKVMTIFFRYFLLWTSYSTFAFIKLSLQFSLSLDPHIAIA